MITTDMQIKALKPSAKPFRKGCGRGLNILVHPNGKKYWIYRYKFNNKENNLSLGTYGELSFLQAQKEALSLKQKVKSGFNPSMERKGAAGKKAIEQGNTFKAIAEAMIETHFVGKTDGYRRKSIRYLEIYVYSWIGQMPISEVRPAHVLDCLERIQRLNKGNTIKKVRILINLVMRHALLRGLINSNPCDAIRGMVAIPKPKHMAAFTEENDVRGLMRAINSFKGSMVVFTALRLAPILFVRPKELRTAKWKDIDLDKSEWKFLVTKTNTEHLVPLATQAVKLFRDLYPLTGQYEFVFPNAHDPKKPMSDAAINASLQRLGFDTKTEMTGHGFRAMARTLIHEKLGFDPNVIEHQLAHQVPDSLGRAYNRTRFIEQRKKMMQDYANYLQVIYKV